MSVRVNNCTTCGTSQEATEPGKCLRCRQLRASTRCAAETGEWHGCQQPPKHLLLASWGETYAACDEHVAVLMERIVTP